MPFPYVPQSWEDFPSQVTPIDADRLAHMEVGIADAMPSTDPDWQWAVTEPWVVDTYYGPGSTVFSDGATFYTRYGIDGGDAPTVAVPGNWRPLTGDNLVADIGGIFFETYGLTPPPWNNGVDVPIGTIVSVTVPTPNVNGLAWINALYVAIVDIDAVDNNMAPYDRPDLWSVYVLGNALDYLQDVSVPAATPAGKVLGTTATGEWGPVGFIQRGAGTPEGAVTAAVGSMYLRSDGGAGTTLYIKESGAGNTGWVAK